MIISDLHKKNIEKLYEHKATISRKGKSVVNHVTKFNGGIIATDIDCYLSQGGRVGSSNTSEKNNINEIQYSNTLFISPDVDIQTGDLVEVTFKNGMKRIYKAGEPLIFISHLEVPMTREGVV